MSTRARLGIDRCVWLDRLSPLAFESVGFGVQSYVRTTSRNRWGALVTMMSELSDIAGESFLKQVQTNPKAASALDFANILPPDAEIVEALRKPLVAHTTAAELHDNIAHLRGAQAQVTMLLTFIADEALPLIDNFNMDSGLKLPEHHELLVARLVVAERKSGVAIGSALANLSAFQVSSPPPVATRPSWWRCRSHLSGTHWRSRPSRG